MAMEAGLTYPVYQITYHNFSRFWIFGCMALDNLEYFVLFEVDFFTAKDPRETSEFCGCFFHHLLPCLNFHLGLWQAKNTYAFVYIRAW